MSNNGENNEETKGSTEIEMPGARLRRAREAIDLSREEVANHLKLSLETIEYLENGEVENIAAPVFVAGYLRSYAKLVNLSGDKIVEDFKALAAMELPSMDPASSPAANDYGQVGETSSLGMSLSGHKGVGLTFVWGIVIVLLLVAAYVFLTDNNETSSGKGVISNKTGEIAPRKNSLTEELPAEEEPVTVDSKETELEKPSSDIEEQLNEVSEVKIPEPFIAGSSGSAQASIESQAINLSELTLYFSEDSWVDVSDSKDSRLLYRLAKAGMSHTVTGFAPFNVRLGFVKGVSIMFNGESYDLSRFANRKSARFMVGENG